MDPREYRDARWYALVREAEDLGVPTQDAPGLVDQVLTEQARRIRRAEDPDPVVHAALAAAVHSPARTGPSRWPAVVVLATVLSAAGLVVVLARPDPPPTDHLDDDQVPSLFGYDGTGAARLLEERGLRVRVEPFRSCEVLDRVVASDPPAGTTYDHGDRVVVYTSLPVSNNCVPRYEYREAAWQFLDFANGRGPAPAFAPRVWVYPDDGHRLVLTDAEAADPDAWADTGVFAEVRTASADVTLLSERPLLYAVPALRVIGAAEDLGSCGVPATAVAGTADALAILVRPADRGGCSLRLELYRDRAGRIEGVALYRASS